MGCKLYYKEHRNFYYYTNFGFLYPSMVTQEQKKKS